MPFRRPGGFTLVELLIVIAVISILFAIAAPWVLNARRSAREAAAIAALTAINDAQSAYRAQCGGGGYAASLPVLGQPHPRTGAAFLSPDLTSGAEVVKSGYLVRMYGTAPPEPRKDCNGVDTVDAYVATADPAQPGQTGARFFGTNTSRVIYEHNETLVGRMPGAGAPDVGVELRR